MTTTGKKKEKKEKKVKEYLIIDQDCDEYGPHPTVKECVDQLVEAFDGAATEDHYYTVYSIVGRYSLTITPAPPVQPPPPKITIKER